MATEHTCPYEGEKWTEISEQTHTLQLCGEKGWLCKRCEQDRADYRAHVVATSSFLMRHRPDEPVGSEFMAWLQRLGKPQAERDG